ncbi:MAG TPA: LemA family protein [Candidatus Thiothrix moscowensis]|uniref:LemA family protein n=1 Tax=unclassified Thiothrix TaxID=2636184 RepID=UPI001A29807F|nr:MULTISPECIES: LemA family protein [unclassified Thiothrix]MBJ6608815.1 LemA family protein [Candidatus Thiothrix moscowensis]HRJ51791.1 LemA family protein [Candidatus Thiothrix moscowensis]HRJ92106.1 LemA family protein [Candidatus Thiothrix moscowensis]
MNTGLIIFLSLLGGLVLWAILLYNQLVALKNNTAKAWSNIDVLLKQRNAELPKLVAVCKEHMQYEQATLQKVMEARNRVASAMQSGDMGALGAAEGALRIGLGNLFAVAEAYPELKASDSFRHLRERITGLEDSIADRREFYNDSAAINNTRIEQFPDVVIAKAFSFKPFRLMSFSAEETSDVDVAAHFTA